MLALPEPDKSGMKCEDLIALYSRLGLVLGVMVIALALIVEHGAEPLPPQPWVATAMVAQEPNRIRTPRSISEYSRSNSGSPVTQFDWRSTQA
jgi:hypothetical protein